MKTDRKLYTIDEASNLSIDEVHNLYKDFINPNQTDIFSSLPFGNDTFESAEGVHMHTSSGKKILDFTGGLGVLGLGHNHPDILNARIKYQNEKRVEVHKIIFSKYMAALSSSISSLLPNNLKTISIKSSVSDLGISTLSVTFNFKSRQKVIPQRYWIGAELSICLSQIVSRLCKFFFKCKLPS